MPFGANINFNKLDKVLELEKIGYPEIKNACFVLGKKEYLNNLFWQNFFIFIDFLFKVAGGLGERLGYKGIKIAMPIDLITKISFFEYYSLFIKAY